MCVYVLVLTAYVWPFWQLVLIICSCDWLAVLLFIVFALLITDMNLTEAQQFTLAL